MYIVMYIAGVIVITIGMRLPAPRQYTYAPLVVHQISFRGSCTVDK